MHPSARRPCCRPRCLHQQLALPLVPRSPVSPLALHRAIAGLLARPTALIGQEAHATPITQALTLLINLRGEGHCRRCRAVTCCCCAACGGGGRCSACASGRWRAVDGRVDEGTGGQGFAHVDRPEHLRCHHRHLLAVGGILPYREHHLSELFFGAGVALQQAVHAPALEAGTWGLCRQGPQLAQPEGGLLVTPSCQRIRRLVPP
mmetsp:Transcript_32340/g.71525  ORF Transcript_32340/g.71525 Transcript_32340/m.71525 type:complete len:205 (+) Transcript_32340:25-639(+)